MEPVDLLAQLASDITVHRVFGEPYERDGVTIIPAAAVRGGGAGRSERPEKADRKEGGGGLGLVARPVGAYVISDGKVRWEPAFDLNRAILGGQIVVAVVALLVRWALAGRRGRRGRG
jgi:uncharacterized spore protein YtfJ